MADIAVLGSINMDLVVKTASMPRPGETVLGHGFVTVPGGKGANQAAAAARLGARVEMIGRVGADSFGDTLIRNLGDQGVGASHVLRDEQAASGIALIIVDSGGENSIVVAPGANGCISMADVQSAQATLSQARCLIMQFEIPLEVVRQTISLARVWGVYLIVNAAPAQEVDADFLQGINCLVVNEFEALTLTGIQVDDLAGASRAAHRLLQAGCETAIVTLGARGAYYVSKAEEQHVPARQVKAVDTTAAGDAFVGALAVAQLKGLPLAEAVRYATCAGTLATTVLGAQTSLPTAERVQAFYERGVL